MTVRGTRRDRCVGCRAPLNSRIPPSLPAPSSPSLQQRTEAEGDACLHRQRPVTRNGTGAVFAPDGHRLVVLDLLNGTLG